MKLNDIQNEGLGDSLKTAGAVAKGLAGKAKTAIGKVAAEPFGPSNKLGILGTAFGRAVGFDASQGWAGNAQKGIAKQKFIGTFVQKMIGFISSTEEAVKDDLLKIQQQQIIQQAQQKAKAQGQPPPNPSQIIVPKTYQPPRQESINFDLMLKIVLKEDATDPQAAQRFIQQYASTIEQGIISYMSGQVGNLGPQVKNSSVQIAQKISMGEDYVSILEDLGSAIFDQYYGSQRQSFVQSHPAADIPLSSDGQQVLAALQKLDKKEQQIVMQKLKQGGNLF